MTIPCTRRSSRRSRRNRSNSLRWSAYRKAQSIPHVSPGTVPRSLPAPMTETAWSGSSRAGKGSRTSDTPLFDVLLTSPHGSLTGLTSGVGLSGCLSAGTLHACWSLDISRSVVPFLTVAAIQPDDATVAVGTPASLPNPSTSGLGFKIGRTPPHAREQSRDPSRKATLNDGSRPSLRVRAGRSLYAEDGRNSSNSGGQTRLIGRPDRPMSHQMTRCPPGQHRGRPLSSFGILTVGRQREVIPMKWMFPVLPSQRTDLGSSLRPGVRFTFGTPI